MINFTKVAIFCTTTILITKKSCLLAPFFTFFEKISKKRLPVQNNVVTLQSQINKMVYVLTPWLSW